MSRNFEVLSRAEQEQTTLAAESKLAVDLILENRRTAAPILTAIPPARPEILKLVHLLFLSSVNAPRHVLFCGVGEDQGAAKVSAATAKALSGEVSSRVCLVDAATPDGSMQSALELDRSVFACSQPSDSRGSLARQIGANLWFASIGSQGFAGTAECGTEQMCANLLDLRKDFEYVVVDAPALGTDISASVLGQVTDGVVLILEANVTRRVTTRSAKQTLETANVRLLGTVLNNRTFPIPEKIYRWL